MEKFEVQVRDIFCETDDAYSVILDKHRGLEGYEAGQFVNVFGFIDGQWIQRSYSFSSAPSVDEFPVLTIKKVPGGLVSNLLINQLQPGSMLNISQSLGRFTLNDDYLKTRMIFIAGGSGITPIFGLIKEGLHRSPTAHFTLLYANRNAQVIFYKALEDLARRYQNRLSIHYFIEEGALEQGKGQLHMGKLTKKFLKDIYQEESLQSQDPVYLCGPTVMIEEVMPWLKEAGWKDEAIHTEQHVHSKSGRVDTGQFYQTFSRVNLKNLNGTEVALLVSAERDILTEFLDKGFALPHSCREAMCGMCAAKLVSGRVRMRENYALNDAKLAEGYVLLCKSTPITEVVELSYDQQNKKL